MRLRVCCALLGSAALCCAQQASDKVFDAMKGELSRSMTLSLQQLEKPYYVSYAIETGHQWGATAVMGGLLAKSSQPFRYPQMKLRVGTYKFDQTNFAGGGRGASYSLSGFPLDDDVGVIRQYLWLQTDSAYKASLDAIARKRSVLRSVTVSDELADFAPAKPNTILKDRPLIQFDDNTWIERTKRVSAIFNTYTNLRASVADYSAIDVIHRYVDSEGTQIRLPQSEGQFQIRASAQAPDGMILRDAALFYTNDITKMPSEEALTKAAKDVAEGVTKLAAAPMGENYSGPILFEGIAGPQLLGEVLARSLHISRKAVGAAAAAVTELEGRRGVRIMPEMFDVTDDPTLPLFGHTEVDDEGVSPKPLSIVEKGVLKDFLRTRTPVRGYNESNGRSLLGGTPAPTNLIVKAHETSSIADLKKKMIDLCQQRGLKYAIIVKKMDFPSTAAGDEMRRLMSGGSGRAVSMPLYVYKLFLDGHEEQVRGVKMRGVNARSLKDILAAGSDENRLDYLENGAPFAQVGGGGYTAAVTVVGPSLLIDDLELTKMEDELPKLPVAGLAAAFAEMRILGRYVFREILAGTFLATVIATFVIFLRTAAGPLFELLVRTKHAEVALELIGFSVLPILMLSIPFGVLVGILIGLGRMSGDNEMVAMRSTGISTRRVAAPVLLFALLATLVSGATSVWFYPLAIKQKFRLMNKIAGEEVTANVPPRIFQEQFTNDNTVLYVNDVLPGTGPTVWKGIVIADTSRDRKSAHGGGNPTGPIVTLAREAIAFPDQEHGRIQLHMLGQSTHETSMDPQKGEIGFHTLTPFGDTALDEAPPREQSAKAFQDMLTRDLRKFIREAKQGSQDWIDASLELHKRLALPVACLMLAMVGIPLGTSSRRGGRSSGYVWAIFLCFCCYYLAFIALTHAAQASHSLSPMLASWLPNIVFGGAGLILIARMEAPGDRDLLGGLASAIGGWATSVAAKLSFSKERPEREHRSFIHITVVRIMDNYVLNTFNFYFILWISAFVAMTQIYNFFELLGDIVKNNIPMSQALQYHLFLTPELIYRLLPFGVLLAVLVTFGIMTKNNEVTAFKACGISVRRLGIPVILMSGAISAAAFAANYSWIPTANQTQDALRNVIKGRAAQTFKNPGRKWVFHDNRVFYFLHFDIEHNVMAEPWVYEIDPHNWQLKRQINAKSARWSPDVKAWIFEQGQVIDICERTFECNVTNFTTASFPEITETPDNTFLKEVKQDLQMNYVDLGNYIKDLNEHGFDTVTLQVQYYKKFATPLFALTIALISIPFGFLVGNRGAMTGVGVGIGLAIAYLAIGTLFEQMGNVGSLRPDVAAWAPNVIFSLSGLYLILRMRS